MDQVGQKQEELVLASEEFIEKFCRPRVWFRDRKEDDKVLDTLSELIKREEAQKKTNKNGTRKKRARKTSGLGLTS